MLEYTAAEQAIIKSDSAVKNFRVHFPNGELSDLTNENIVYNSVKFTESVCSDSVFRFGCAEASVIEFETVNVQNIIGMLIECSMEFTNGQTTVIVPYGTFLVDTCPRDHQNMTHRRVTAYSLIKYMLDVDGFLQNKILPLSKVHVSLAAIAAYVTGDTSQFTATQKNGNQLKTPDTGITYLYDSSGIPYFVSFIDNSIYGRAGVRRYTCNYETAYRFDYEETGETSGAQIGQLITDWLDANGYDLTYDTERRKIFASNADAVRFVYSFLWSPTELMGTISQGYALSYRSNTAQIGRVVPIVHGQPFGNQLFTYIMSLNAADQLIINKYSSANVWSDSATTTELGTINVSFSANATCTIYSGASGKLNSIAIKSTMEVSNTLAYIRRVSNRDKMYYTTMYTYANAYSNREIIDGWAEINGAYVHSERDGSVSMETLDNSTPYAITGSDVDGSAWWDEYNVNPIGTINYKFRNPFTNKDETGSYQFDSGKSVYDLSDNKLLCSMDFTPLKVSSTSAMTDTNYFYRYNGDFYYFNGSAWVNGGKYSDVRSLVHYVIAQLFIPHISAVNFTPVEMTVRGMPFLEAGDAFTFTADDGTVLHSYVLNHSFDGIQYIQEEITSVSGEII